MIANLDNDKLELAVATLINNDYISREEFIQAVGGYGVLYDCYYRLTGSEKLELELADLDVWGEFYISKIQSFIGGK
jgi:hypothetical protein